MNKEAAIIRLELMLGRLLRAGLATAAVLMSAGLLLWIGGVPGSVATRLLTGGLIVLMATPPARVVASLIVYARMRDWFFVGTTMVVFVVLLAAWLLKS